MGGQSYKQLSDDEPEITEEAVEDDSSTDDATASKKPLILDGGSGNGYGSAGVPVPGSEAKSPSLTPPPSHADTIELILGKDRPSKRFENAVWALGFAFNTLGLIPQGPLGSDVALRAWGSEDNLIDSSGFERTSAGAVGMLNYVSIFCIVFYYGGPKYKAMGAYLDRAQYKDDWADFKIWAENFKQKREKIGLFHALEKWYLFETLVKWSVRLLCLYYISATFAGLTLFGTKTMDRLIKVDPNQPFFASTGGQVVFCGSNYLINLISFINIFDTFIAAVKTIGSIMSSWFPSCGSQPMIVSGETPVATVVGGLNDNSVEVKITSEQEDLAEQKRHGAAEMILEAVKTKLTEGASPIPGLALYLETLRWADYSELANELRSLQLFVSGESLEAFFELSAEDLKGRFSNRLSVPSLTTRAAKHQRIANLKRGKIVNELSSFKRYLAQLARMSFSDAKFEMRELGLLLDDEPLERFNKLSPDARTARLETVGLSIISHKAREIDSPQTFPTTGIYNLLGLARCLNVSEEIVSTKRLVIAGLGSSLVNKSRQDVHKALRTIGLLAVDETLYDLEALPLEELEVRVANITEWHIKAKQRARSENESDAERGGAVPFNPGSANDEKAKTSIIGFARFIEYVSAKDKSDFVRYLRVLEDMAPNTAMSDITGLKFETNDTSMLSALPDQFGVQVDHFSLLTNEVMLACVPAFESVKSKQRIKKHINTKGSQTAATLLSLGNKIFHISVGFCTVGMMWNFLFLNDLADDAYPWLTTAGGAFSILTKHLAELGNIGVSTSSVVSLGCMMAMGFNGAVYDTQKIINQVARRPLSLPMQFNFGVEAVIGTFAALAAFVSAFSNLDAMLAMLEVQTGEDRGQLSHWWHTDNPDPAYNRLTIATASCGPFFLHYWPAVILLTMFANRVYGVCSKKAKNTNVAVKGLDGVISRTSAALNLNATDFWNPNKIDAVGDFEVQQNQVLDGNMGTLQDVTRMRAAA